MAGAIDISRLINLVKSPGIDTRVWLSFAEVTAIEVVTGNNAGIYVDVTLMPYEEEYTAWVASPYAGNGAGLYYPMKAGDTVIVAIPYGDSAAGVSIIGRFNAGDAPPPAEFIKNGVPTDEIVLVAEAEVNIRYVVSGAGSIIFEPRGTGKFAVGGEPGSAGMEAMVMGQTLTSYLSDFRDAFNTHVHPTAPAGPVCPPLPTPIPLIPVAAVPPGVLATKAEVK